MWGYIFCLLVLTLVYYVKKWTTVDPSGYEDVYVGMMDMAMTCSMLARACVALIRAPWGCGHVAGLSVKNFFFVNYVILFVESYWVTLV